MHASKHVFYRKYIKRLLDIVLSLTGIIILAPALVIIALLVGIKLGRPVLFKQKRPGFNEKIFTMYKFRTMTEGRDAMGNLLPDDVRLTKFGKALRSMSLDELPELFNVLKGDMSIIGPRPQLVKDLVFMSPEQRLRQTVMPGLSGLAQVNGRNAMSWEDKFKYDLDYIDNITFLGDCKIIFMTILKVFKRDGISAVGMETAEDFGDYLLRENKISEAYYMEQVDISRKLMF